VDGLDLAAAGFVGVEAKPTGRPGYAPADLLKLYIHGYLNRIRSSRRLEAETRRNIEVIWPEVTNWPRDTHSRTKREPQAALRRVSGGGRRGLIPSPFSDTSSAAPQT
jgi:Transposase domain (DUF772)